MVSITATNAAGSITSSSYTITVAPGVPPAITSGTPSAATVGTAYSFIVTASGFPDPTFAVSSGVLPPGLSLDAVTGAITGTPTAAGNFPVTITAGNLNGPDASVTFTLAVAKTALASTGFDPAPAGFVGVLVLLFGAAVLVLRRAAR